MHLTSEVFNDLLANKKLTLTFIGMSGIGKTHFANMLARAGFKHMSCDDLIAPRISNSLHNVADVGIWMGQPYSEGYRERERHFLELEEDVTKGALRSAESNTVIDTTGSVIYLSKEVTNSLKNNSLIIYFEARSSIYQEMLARYLTEPKPVIWGSSFTKTNDETDEDALKRCYPGLLRFRAKKYRQLADVTLPQQLASSFRDAEDVLRAIGRSSHEVSEKS